MISNFFNNRFNQVQQQAPNNEETNGLLSFYNRISQLPVETSLSWKLVEYNHPEFDDFAGKNHAAVIMNHYIVILGNNSEYRVGWKDIIIDTKSRMSYCLKIMESQLVVLNRFIACYWRNSQIIIFGENNDKTGIYLGILTITMTANGFEGSIRSVPVSIPKLEGCETMHVYKDKLYIVSTGKAENNPGILYCVNLEVARNQQEITHKKLLEGSRSGHTSYLYKNMLFICFQNNFEDGDLETAQIAVNLDTLEQTRVKEDVSLKNEPNIQFQEANRKLYLFAHSHSSTDYNTLWVQNLETQAWKELSTKGRCPDLNNKGTMSIIDNRIFIFGGQLDDEDSSDLWCLPLPETNSVRRTIVLPEINISNPSTLLKLLLTEAPYHDITFEVESEVIAAHKWVLTKRCRYFANMFSSGMLEAQSSKIIVSDMKASTFRAFLEFLYSNQIELNEDLAMELLQQADKYVVPDLKKLCEKYLATHLNFENYTKVASLAEFLDIKLLREAMVFFIVRNAKKLGEREDFEQISASLLRDAILKMAIQHL